VSAAEAVAQTQRRLAEIRNARYSILGAFSDAHPSVEAHALTRAIVQELLGAGQPYAAREYKLGVANARTQVTGNNLGVVFVTAVARAMLGAGIVLSLPGALIALLLRMRLRVLTTWAAIPVFSIAAVFVLGEITNLVRVPFGVPAFAIFVAALALGVLVRRRTSHGEDAGREIARHLARLAPPGR
jgi:uncharacterized membrane protein YfcA